MNSCEKNDLLLLMDVSSNDVHQLKAWAPIALFVLGYSGRALSHFVSAPELLWSVFHLQAVVRGQVYEIKAKPIMNKKAAALVVLAVTTGVLESFPWSHERLTYANGLSVLGWFAVALAVLIIRPQTPPYIALSFATLHLILDGALLFQDPSVLPIVLFLLTASFVSVCLLFPVGIVALEHGKEEEAEDGQDTNSPQLESVPPLKDVLPSSHSPLSKDVSPHLGTSLASWLTFAWVGPFIYVSSQRSLSYSDVWALVPEMRADSVSSSCAYQKKRSRGLLTRLFYNNSVDIIMSLVLEVSASILSFCGPYFLKQILSSLEDRKTLSTAYFYATLALMCQLLKAEVSLNQLWFSRRCISRSQTQLMTEIYEKALRTWFLGGSDGAKDTKETKKEDKAKKTKGKKDRDTSIGNTLQLMSSDSSRVAEQVDSLTTIIATPVELVVGIVFLYRMLGWASVTGLLVLIVTMPLNQILVKRRIKMHKEVLSARDNRLTLLNEFIMSIRFIKYSASEKSWLGRVLDSREKELQLMLRTRFNNLMLNLLWNFTPDLMIIVSFMCYTKIQHQELSIPVAFTSLALFALIRAPLNTLPAYITQLMQTYISVGRIRTFLDGPEVEGVTPSNKIQIVDGEFAYSDDTEKPPEEEEVSSFHLTGINLSLPEKKLTLICGATGSGKSSLLLSLLGELHTIQGSVYMRRSDGLHSGISYSSQTPWLENDTIKNNILFGSTYDEKRYKQVITACALEPDLKMFEAGDETQIGERGITLSGGQKARVALARAVYAPSHTVLLDDPLSAVDAHVGRLIFTKCLKGPLMAGRTVILVTHHLSLCLPGAEYVVQLQNGTIIQQGSPAEVDLGRIIEQDDQDPDNIIEELFEKEDSSDEDTTGSDNATAAVEHIATSPLAAGDGIASETSDGRVTQGDESAGKGSQRDVPSGNENQGNSPSGRSKQGETSSAVDATGTLATSTGSASDSKLKKGQLVAEEHRETGRVKWKVYKTYLSAAGWNSWICVFALLLVGRGFRILDRYWLKVWGEHYEAHVTEAASLFSLEGDRLGSHTLARVFATSAVLSDSFFTLPDASKNVDFYLAVYLLISVLNLVVAGLTIIAGFTGLFRAARSLFRGALTRISKAPFRYFDTTPTGRILNRFSSDFQSIDYQLSDQVRMCLTQVFTFLVNLGVIIVVSPVFTPVAAIIVVCFVRLSLSYVRCSRDLRRLASSARSPIYSKFGETLGGIVTCRAFGAELFFLRDFFDRLDTLIACRYASDMANRYLFWRLDCVGAISIALTTYLAVWSGVSSGLAALAITSAQTLVQSIYRTCRLATALEVNLNAVERVTEVLDVVQEESTEQIAAYTRPPAHWPGNTTDGIRVENLTLRYAPSLNPVIHGISFAIKPRQKVGIVGRTGSGKSTLALALLRVIERDASPDSAIVIDGIDIASVPLEDLRSRMTLIPQEAVLFSGTVRSNLDPFNEYTEFECVDVLNRVLNNESNEEFAEDELKNNDNSRITLDFVLTAGGSNLSAGQRQLLAMARALLRKSPILIMDEATASVDFQTDAHIQRTIRCEFESSTVITIAHRLKTVVDYDMILVLEHGHIVEYDAPVTLMRNEDGYFRKMCEEATEWPELKAMI